jgi:hypothetical protein
VPDGGGGCSCVRAAGSLGSPDGSAPGSVIFLIVGVKSKLLFLIDRGGSACRLRPSACPGSVSKGLYFLFW